MNRLVIIKLFPKIFPNNKSGLDRSSNLYSSFYKNPSIEKEFASLLDYNTVYPIINNLRCIKSKAEIDLMRETCAISSKAHIYAMTNCMPTFNEYQLAALFQEYFAYAGADSNAYYPICGGGRNASILHYETNTEELKDGDLVLCDMGAQKNGMNSDITCTYPVNGKFSNNQKEIYNIVLKAQTTSIEMLKPDVPYSNVQDNAFMVILQGLIDLGLLQGDIQEMFQNKIHKVFMPHRLGHYLGYRTHDVGLQRKVTDPGNIEFNKQYDTIEEDILRPNMCLTVEPGIYFVSSLLDDVINDKEKAKYFNFDRINTFMSVGGVRIEDDLCITEIGYENFTKVVQILVD